MVTYTAHAKQGILRLLLALSAIGGLLIATASQAASRPLLHGSWKAVQPGDTPASVLQAAAEGRLQVFRTDRLHTFSHRDLGTWVVLQSTDANLSGPMVLSIPSAPFGGITRYDRSGPVTSSSVNDPDPQLHGYGRLAFAIPGDALGMAPVLLKFEPANSMDAPVMFHLLKPFQFESNNAQWLAMASASLAVMLAMALMALCFAGMLGDSTFAWYAVYVTSYAGLQSIQTGYIFHPLHLVVLSAVALPLATTLSSISVIAAVMFMIRFCNLRRHASWLRALLLVLAGMLAMLALLQVTGIASVRPLVHTLFNPLLALVCGVMVLASSVAFMRGSRSALFFLFGWLPLLVLTALTSVQVGGALSGMEWLNDVSLAAGAIEALVLAVGLADRSLTMRRDHVLARELANKDPLTGVLNRRAWIEATQLQLKASRQVHTLLFMDLDHFKTLNDELGHNAGDRALIAMAEAFATELRPQDIFGRFGGEEFLALLSVTDAEAALHVAQRLCRRLHRMEIPMNRKGDVLTISIGLATRRPDDTLTSLVERADAAMYAAKAGGRNRVVDQAHVENTQRPILRPSRALADFT
jgi:diguanylate cyclase (GGDEF)-like protein